jgi:hypothetical protein
MWPSSKIPISCPGSSASTGARRSPAYELLGKMTREFVAAIDKLAQHRKIPVVHFEKGQRKEAVAEPYFAQACGVQEIRSRSS